MAMTFVEVDERADWKNIVRLVRQNIPVVERHPYESTIPLSVTPPRPTMAQRNGGRNGGGGGRNERAGGFRRRR